MTLTTAVVLAQLRSPFALKAIDAATPLLPVAANRDVSSALLPGDVSSALPPDVSSALPRDNTSTPPNERPATNLIATQVSVSAREDMGSGAPLAKAAARATPLAISVEPSQVRSDDHFAEIRLHRNLLEKNSSFTWWTEPATAKPGVDYVPESVAIQTFPAGYRSTRLYEIGRAHV